MAPNEDTLRKTFDEELTRLRRVGEEKLLIPGDELAARAVNALRAAAAKVYTHGEASDFTREIRTAVDRVTRYFGAFGSGEEASDAVTTLEALLTSGQGLSELMVRSAAGEGERDPKTGKRKVINVKRDLQEVPTPMFMGTATHLPFAKTPPAKRELTGEEEIAQYQRKAAGRRR